MYHCYYDAERDLAVSDSCTILVNALSVMMPM